MYTEGELRRLLTEHVESPMQLDSLLGWSLMAAEAVRALAERAGYWGSYRVRFEARNYAGIPVLDSQAEYEKCSDPAIDVELEWDTVEVRDDPIGAAARLYRRLMWAFGQHDQMWVDDKIRRRVALLQR